MQKNPMNIDPSRYDMKTGSDINDLKATLSALTFSEYLDSFLLVSDNADSNGTKLMYPVDGRPDVQFYRYSEMPYNNNYAFYTWVVSNNRGAGTIAYVEYKQPLNSAFTPTTPTITSWTLYIRKQ